jgi:PPOX class probable F420-dependent enzyme
MPRSSSYPQAPELTETEFHTLLSDALILRLGTQNEDGSIHLAPVWFAYEEPELILGTQAASRKIRNIERDPHVTALVDVSEPTLIGAIIYGTARVDRSPQVKPARERIFSRYMDTESATELTESLAARWDPALIRITPQRVVSFDYRKGFL